MEEQNTKPKRYRAQRSAAKRLRDSRVVEMASSGVPIKEIAGEMNIDRTTVTRILSSNEIKAIVNTANSRVHSLVDKALKTVEDAMDARRVAGLLGIPFYVWDFSERFAETVVADFVSEYAAGRTPNPGSCNGWKGLERWALKAS